MTTDAYQGLKKNEMHTYCKNSAQPNQNCSEGWAFIYMLLTNKTPINQRKTEIHKSICITTMFYRFQLHCRIIIKITIKMFHRLNMSQ